MSNPQDKKQGATHHLVADEDIVECLESLLSRAREGRIQEFAFVAKDRDNDVSTAFFGGDKSKLISAIEILKQRIIYVMFVPAWEAARVEAEASEDGKLPMWAKPGSQGGSA